jgi:hypothetical protein
VKNVSTDTTTVTISGNGSSIADPVALSLGASFTVGLSMIGIDFQFMDSAWHVI